MRTAKRVLSLVLSLAMLLTGVNLGTPTSVQAAETKNEKYLQSVNGTFEHSANENGVTRITVGDKNKDDDGKDITLREEGSKFHAPYIPGETLGSGFDNCGSNRYGCLVFSMPANMDFTQISSAKVSFSVNGASNVNNSNGWVKAALYQTENKEVTAGDETTYAAINDDYSKDAAMWSDKKITDENSLVNEASGIIKTGQINFDVKKAVEAAVQNGDERLVLRLQVPRGGLIVDSTKDITLTIDTSIPATVTVDYVDGEGNKIQDSKTVDVSLGSKYTYDIPDEDKKVRAANTTLLTRRQVKRKLRKLLPGIMRQR